MEENLKYWGKVATPPPNVLKRITGGRISGMTDIRPQWRYQVMTETYGPCGIGWKFKVVKKWTEPASDNQLFAFVDIELFVKVDDVWSEAIPGTGGSMMIAKEKGGSYSSDEAYKMATTDALSTAMKMIGVAADIYMGNWDGSKYTNRQQPAQPAQKQSRQPKNNDNFNKIKRSILTQTKDTIRYGQRLSNIVEFGISYTRNCWNKTPDDIKSGLGKDFKTELYSLAETFETKNKSNESPPEEKSLKGKIKGPSEAEPAWMKNFNQLSEAAPEQFEAAKKEIGAPSQVNFQDFKKRVNELVDQNNAA